MKTALHKQFKSSRKPKRLFAMWKTSKFHRVSLKCLHLCFIFNLPLAPRTPMLLKSLISKKHCYIFLAWRGRERQTPYWSAFLLYKLQLNEKCIWAHSSGKEQGVLQGNLLWLNSVSIYMRSRCLYWAPPREMSCGPMPKTAIDINRLKESASRAQQCSSHVSQQWRGYSELRQKSELNPSPCQGQLCCWQPGWLFYHSKACLKYNIS